MTQKLSTDQFAEFVAKQILTIENYKFDIFYDIRRIMSIFESKRSVSDQAQRDNFHLMVRDNGCDLVDPDDENYKTYKQRSDKIYSLTFCWNCDYMHNETFCEVEKL